MTLFDIRLEQINAENPGAIETPYGSLATYLRMHDLDTLRADPMDTRGDGSRRWFRWESRDVDVELLQGELAPVLPPGMHVDGCVAAVWRMKGRPRGRLPLRGEPSSHLLCCWANQPDAARGGPDTGEGLEALTWNVSGGSLSLGTEDAQVLMNRAQKGRFSTGQIEFDSASFLKPDQSGLEVPIPTLKTGEAVQVHFVVAWRTAADADDASTWFAVDQDPAHLLPLLET